MKYEYKVFTFNVEEGQETQDYLNNAGSIGYKVINVSLITIDDKQMMRFILEKSDEIRPNIPIG